MKYFSSIQFLRFIGASFVILAHMGIGELSYKGMDLLFTISGFVIYLTGHEDLGKGFRPAVHFMKRRFVRIFTFYWLLFFGLIGFGFYKVSYDTAFFKNVFLVPGHKSFLEVTWSLSYELYFYSIFGGLILFVSSAKSRYFFIGFWLFTFFVLILQWTDYSLLGHPINFLVGQNIWQILTGVLACMVYLEMARWDEPRRLKASILLLFVGFTVFISYIGYYKTASFITTAIGSACILLAVTHLEADEKLRFPNFITSLGNASYIAYLIHIPMIHYFSSSPALKTTNQWFILSGVWLLSLGLHRFVERPLVKRVNGLLSRT